MSGHKLARVLTLLALFCATSSVAQELSGDQVKSLDGQVQEIKSDVLNIASELNNLEERLLYPSGTQLSIFIAVDQEKPFRLDAVKIEIDGDLATHHIYSFKELEALQMGGVQRAFTGNVVAGEHAVNVTVIGKDDNGKDINTTSSFSFSKGVKPKTLGITLREPGLGNDGIHVGDW